MSNNSWGDAALIIKDAIIRSRYQAATLVNRELLSLYYAVGRYVSQNSRVGSWGKGAIKQISDDIQNELPGIRGFSESAIRKMRLFYEAWQKVFVNRSSAMNDLSESDTNTNRSLSMNDLPENRPSVTDDINRLQKVTNRQLANDDLRVNPNFETDNEQEAEKPVGADYQ